MKPKQPFIWIMLCAMALAACSDGAPSASTGSSESTPGHSAPPTEQHGQASDGEQGSGSGSGGQATPAGGEQGHSGGGSPAATPGGGPQTADAGSGVCVNAYLPVIAGATWTFRWSTAAFTETLADSITAVQRDGFTLTSQFPGLTRTRNWVCRSEGLVMLEYIGGAAGGTATGQSNGQYETTGVRGVTLPSALTPGDQWSQAFDIRGVRTLSDGQTSTTEGTVTYAFQAIGTESVTVPAGTFEAMRIQVDTTMDLTVSSATTSTPATFTLGGSDWYAPGVGWVMSASSGTMFGQPYSQTIELTSYSIP